MVEMADVLYAKLGARQGASSYRRLPRLTPNRFRPPLPPLPPGPNGAGKSTLVKLMTGELKPDVSGSLVCMLLGSTVLCNWS